MPVEPRNFNRFWDRQVAGCGIRRITVHDARRTCATILRDLKVHPSVAQRILRHAQVSITLDIYTEVTDDATREALRQLGEALE
jgi:integrase